MYNVGHQFTQLHHFYFTFCCILDRYKNLPNSKDQLKFVNVQIELLQEFTNQLNFRTEENCTNPLDGIFLSVLNAAYFVTYILEDWSEQAVG